MDSGIAGTGFPTREEAMQREEKIAEIDKVMKTGNFEKTIELATKCIDDCKDKDLDGEARRNYFIASCLIEKYQEKTSLADYNKAKAHLNRSLEIFSFLEKSKEFVEYARMKKANVLATLGALELFGGNYQEGTKTCQKALDIFRTYRNKEGIKRVTAQIMSLQAMRIHSDIKRTALKESF